jgi:hypothetical protein
MTTQGLPQFPSKRSLAAKVARYRAAAEAHARGEHRVPVRGCARCAKSAQGGQ